MEIRCHAGQPTKKLILTNGGLRQKPISKSSSEITSGGRKTMENVKKREDSSPHQSEFWIQMDISYLPVGIFFGTIFYRKIRR